MFEGKYYNEMQIGILNQIFLLFINYLYFFNG